MSSTRLGNAGAARAIRFGPYQSAAGVRMHVESFLALAFPRYSGRMGIVWRDPAGLAVCVREPTYDDAGDGLSLVLTWHGAVKPPPPPPPRSRFEKIESTIGRFFSEIGNSFDKGMAAYGRAQIAQAQAEMAAEQEIYRSLHNLVADHPAIAATVAVGIDIMGVVASGATVIAAGMATIGATGTFVGIAADTVTVPVFTSAAASTAASLALLVADSIDLGLYLSGDEAMVDEYEQSSIYRRTEGFAPLVALLDPGREAFQAMRSEALLPAAEGKLAAVRATSAEADASAHAAQNALEAAKARDAKLNAYLNKPGHVATPVADDAARMKSAARVSERASHAQSTREAAQKAAQHLLSLQLKAHELQDEIDTWWRWQWNARKESGPRDLAAAGVSMTVWSANNPFARDFGKHDAAPPLMARSQAAMRSLFGVAEPHDLFSMNVIASHRSGRRSRLAVR